MKQRYLRLLLALCFIPALWAAPDWPQLQNNIQRHGWGEAAVVPPVKLEWIWSDGLVVPDGDFSKTQELNTEKLNRTAQPVVRDGRVFIGNLNGIFNCLDLKTGETLWRTEGLGPVFHTAAVDENKVYFATGLSMIYALDVKTGKIEWQVEGEGPFVTGTLMVDDLVIFSGRDQYLYFVEKENGTVRYKKELDAPSLNTPSSDGKTVFVGAEDACLYAFDLKTGERKWKTQLQGQSPRNYWPVVAGDSVLFRTMYFGPEWNPTELAAMEGFFEKHKAHPWSDVEEKFRDWLTNERPELQTFFIVDKDTGKERYVTTVGVLMRHHDVGPYPVVDREGNVYTWFRTTPKTASHNEVGYATRFPHDVGVLDLKTGTIRSSAPPDSRHGGHIRPCSDDYPVWSGGGDMMYGIHNGGYPMVLFPVKGGETVALVDRAGGSSISGGTKRKLQGMYDYVDDMTGDVNHGRGYSSFVVVPPYLLATYSRQSAIVCFKGEVK